MADITWLSVGNKYSGPVLECMINGLCYQLRTISTSGRPHMWHLLQVHDDRTASVVECFTELHTWERNMAKKLATNILWSKGEIE